MKSKSILKKKRLALVIGNTLGSLFKVAKSNQKTVWLLFLIITIASVFVRFLNYENLVNFHGDAPVHLHEAGDCIEVESHGSRWKPYPDLPKGDVN